MVMSCRDRLRAVALRCGCGAMEVARQEAPGLAVPVHARPAHAGAGQEGAKSRIGSAVWSGVLRMVSVVVRRLQEQVLALA